MTLIWKLLRQNINKSQLIGFALANLIGMSIVLLACQFYFDVNPVFSQKDTLFKKDYFIVTKQVSAMNLFSSTSSTFTTKELEEIKSQPFIKSVGSFTSSRFGVSASLNYPERGIQFSTEMFFESVPESFIDVNTDDWHFSPADNEIPIILPKNYLDLYNFGFAQSRSMPKISESLFKMVSFDITIQGNGSFKQLKGRVVGFSNRLNTILVPESFMTWANSSYGNTPNQQPSRLIAEISDITNPAIASFFKNKNYEVGANNEAASKIAFFLKLIISIVGFIGLIICTLSFFVLSLSIYLLLEKNMEKLQNLRLIGYKKQIITRPYELLTIIVNGSTLLISLVFVFFIKQYYAKLIGNMLPNFETTDMIKTILVGVSIFVLISVINVCIIRRKVK